MKKLVIFTAMAAAAALTFSAHADGLYPPPPPPPFPTTPPYTGPAFNPDPNPNRHEAPMSPLNPNNWPNGVDGKPHDPRTWPIVPNPAEGE